MLEIRRAYHEKEEKLAITRKIVQDWADEHGIELEITEFPRNYQNHGRGGSREGATAKRVMRQMKNDGFTQEEILRATSIMEGKK